MEVEIGRVLRANSVSFAVGCQVAQLQTPAFGGLVKATPLNGSEEMYGLIYDIRIDDDQLVRRLVLADSTPQEIINDQRQNRLLPIEMSVLTIGYKKDGRVRHSLPPRPPLNLDPVMMVLDKDDIIGFSGAEKPAYLRLILRYAGDQIPIEQLLVAHILDMYEKRGNDTAWAILAVQEVIDLLRTNYDVLVPTLEALSEAMPALDLAV